MANDAPEPVAAIDPLEEVLEQASEQTLRLNRIVESIKELSASVNDLGESMQAGLVELRGVVSQPSASGAAPAGTDESFKQTVLERLEVVERETKKAGSLKLLLIVALAIQLVTAVLVFASARGLFAPEAPEPAATVAPEPAPAPAVAPAPPPKPAEAPALPPIPKAKKRGKR